MYYKITEFLKIILHLNFKTLKLNLKKHIVFIILCYTNLLLAQEPTDCINAVIACGNSDITLNVSGIGVQELNGTNVCSSIENNSIWLKVTTVTTGTLGFTLTPNSTNINEDYDFFVFGPNATCGNIGRAIRCSTTNPKSAGLNNNQTGMSATATDTSEGPGANGNSFVKNINVNAGDTYFIVIDRPIGNSPFSLEWTGTATFSEPPINASLGSSTALNLEKCDDLPPFSNGIAEFDIAQNTNSIIGTQSNITVTYHEETSDANIGINALTSPYKNIKNPQTIYARITNNLTGCFDLIDFKLTVNSGPNIAIPTDYFLCDNKMDSDNKNGRVIFDLALKNNEILDGLNPINFNISYYKTRLNAENGSSPLPYLYYNTTPFNETIFVRIEDTTNKKCKTYTKLNLVVGKLPESFNTSLIQCDDDNSTTDGLTSFNLNEATEAITGNTPDRSVTFYTDENTTAELPEGTFKNTTNPQIIYAKTTNNITGCINRSELMLNVTSTATNNATLSICDDDGIEDGLHIFNLNDANTDILKGLPSGLNIVYYDTLNNALLEENPLTETYTNKTPNTQTIYARVENKNDCFGISQVYLSVLPLPKIKTDDLLYYCLNDFPNTISINAALLNGLQSNYTYNWSTGDTTYETQINKPGVYTVAVTGNKCTKLRTVIVEASSIASFQAPNFKIENLSQNNSITVFVTGEGNYQYSLVDEQGTTFKPYQDSNIFNNVIPGVYNVFIQDIKNKCGVVTKSVSVIGFPNFFTPNNDGINDTWQVYGIPNNTQLNTKIYIFNRFGKLIKQLSPQEKGFNGTYNGKILPADDYWFSITLEDGSTHKGHFSLKK